MNKILVANRGEIALRIMRSAREMGISTVAVYSEADRFAPFVSFADEAYHIGPAQSDQSYLVMDKILEVAKKSGADGIHPGYGFLSENANFAELVEKHGIAFIGPKAEAIEVMGSKLAAKKRVGSYNVPLVPGTDEAIDDIEKAKSIAKEIGYPILVKASAGGGGKGMRIVEKDTDFEEQMKRAVSEAESSFGDGRCFIEKFVGKPRHIEIQILADNHGNVIYLFERECSIQRRHQKVIEEAPSSVLSEELRKKMGEAAVNVAKSCNYTGAGTVEFLLDEQLNFYFLEMNTRLQVEHPVTEMITGIDLVREQINVARGDQLAIQQEDLQINGHSLEIRVYAEDPYNNFLPDIGQLKMYRPPLGPGVRVDDAFTEGMEIPVYYDPMIAKLIVHAVDRKTAIKKMSRAIDEYQIRGIATTLDFCKFSINHPAFVTGEFDTHFVDQYMDEFLNQEVDEQFLKMGSVVAFEAHQAHLKSQKPLEVKPQAASLWKTNRKN